MTRIELCGIMPSMQNDNSPLQSNHAEALRTHYEKVKTLHLRDMFSADDKRVDKFTLEACNIYLDYSKNLIVQETMDLLTDLANHAHLEEARNKLFNGEEVNISEHRNATHTQSRQIQKNQNGSYVGDQADAFTRIRKLSNELRQGKLTGCDNQAITDVVCIGIGGSYLGNAMACKAFPTGDSCVQVHFVSTIGSNELNQLLQNLTPQKTLFIITSKSWNNWETLSNFKHVLEWTGGTPEVLKKHFVILSNKEDLISDCDIDLNKFFLLSKSVGGRYSLCSTAGLAFAIHSGIDAFEALLNGAHQMDNHFLNAPLDANMPVIMSLLDIWYINFFTVQSRAILTYINTLELLPDYLQQLEMESNGKMVSQSGEPVPFDTAPVVWGGLALAGQHSFYQLLHQGTRLVPTDFIVEAEQPSSDDSTKLYANFFTHSHLLMKGNSDDNHSYRLYPGNRPSSALMMKKLTPETLGSMVALYEHKVFCNAVIWSINPFDQWGVSEGKKLSKSLYQKLKSSQSGDLDESTDRLIEKYKNWN